MNSKGHFGLSVVKSVIRLICFSIGGYLIYPHSTALSVLCVALVGAEILGLAEEFADKR